MRRFLRLLAISMAAALFAGTAPAETMKMAVTTSFENSGLGKVLLPEVKKDLGLDVKLLVVGTGAALRLGANGDVDAVLVHAKGAELKFMKQGHGLHRRLIMYNDFVLIGPSEDPVGIKKARTAAEALKMIAAAKFPFVSRGDDSGTNKKELALWKEAGFDKADLRGSWYRAAGAGMGATLNVAAGMNAYTMSDRATWLKFGNKRDLALLFAGDPKLFNQYTFIPVNPKTHPGVRTDLALKLEDWLTSPKAAKLINGYRIKGEKLFTFNAKPAPE